MCAPPPPRSFPSPAEMHGLYYYLYISADRNPCHRADLSLSLNPHVYHTSHNSGRPVYLHSLILVTFTSFWAHTDKSLTLQDRIYSYIFTAFVFYPPRTFVTFTQFSSLLYIPTERYVLRVRVAGQFADLKLMMIRGRSCPRYPHRSEESRNREPKHLN
jgi:hypothetical protein